MTLEEVAAVSLIGKAAIAGFILAWIGAALSMIPLLPHRAKFNTSGFSVWKDAELRPKFVRFVGFCALGVGACLVGFAFGGWPTHE